MLCLLFGFRIFILWLMLRDGRLKWSPVRAQYQMCIYKRHITKAGGLMGSIQSMIMRYVMWKNDAVLDQSQSQFTVSILILDHNTAIVT